MAKRLRPEDEAYLGTVVPLGTRPARRVALQAHEPVAAYLDDPGLDVTERESMERYEEHACLEVPLTYGGDVLGILGIVMCVPGRHFSDAEKHLLQGLAAPAAAAIYNARQFAAVAERRRQLTSLLDAGRAVTSTFGLEDVLGAVAREAAELLGCPECLIYEYDDEHHALVWRTRYDRGSGHEWQDPLGTVYPAEDWQDDYELMFAAAPRLQNRDDPLLTASQRAYLAARDLGTTLTVPLRYGDDHIGLLQLLEFGRRRDFGVRELELAAAFGELASAAIHSARLLRRQERQSERLVGLFDASRSMTTALTADDVARVVHEEVVGAMPGERPHVRVWLRDAAGELVAGDAADGAMPGAATELMAQAEAGLLPVQAREDGEARLVVPLAVRGEVLGFIDVLSRRRRYGDELAELLQIVANQASAALANARLYARLAEQAITDGLTGLYNHRYFYERLEQECARACRYGLPLSLLMIDIDDFKGFNDLFGHVLGDDVLRQVGGILRDGTRSGIDLPARYGGEEFAVILPPHACHRRPCGGRPAAAADPRAGGVGGRPRRRGAIRGRGAPRSWASGCALTCSSAAPTRCGTWPWSR